MSEEERSALLVPRGSHYEPSIGENVINDEPLEYNAAVRDQQRYHYYKYGRGDHHLIFSVLLTILCCFCGAWWTIVCTVPAIFYSISARDAEKDGDDEKAERVIYKALQFNLIAILSYIFAVAILVGVAGVITITCTVIIMSAEEKQPIVVTPPTFVVYERRFGTGDHYLLLSIIISIVCFIFCGWLTLICTIPAIFFAISAQDAESRGDNIAMEKNAKTALILDICGAVTGAVTFACVVILVIVRP